MRTETISVYQYSELNDEAKEKAHDNYIHHGNHYVWVQEGLDSVRAFCDYFGVLVTDYCISQCEPSYIKTDMCRETEEELKVIEVTHRMSDDNDYDLEDYISYTTMTIRSMPPTQPEDELSKWATGYSMDYSLLHGWETYLKANPNDNIGALKAAIDEAVKDVLQDMEYQDSEEYFAEVSECNEWEYLEDGTLH